VRWSSGRSAALCISSETHPPTQLRRVRVGVNHTDAVLPHLELRPISVPPSMLHRKLVAGDGFEPSSPAYETGIVTRPLTRCFTFQRSIPVSESYCSTILCLLRKTIFFTYSKALSQFTSSENWMGAQQISLSQHSLHSSRSFRTRSISKYVLYLLTLLKPSFVPDESQGDSADTAVSVVSDLHDIGKRIVVLRVFLNLCKGVAVHVECPALADESLLV